MKTLIFILLATSMLAPVDAAACAYYMPGCLSCKPDVTDSCNLCGDGYRLEQGYRNYCAVCPRGKGKMRDSVPQTVAGICNLDCTNDCAVCGPTAGECLVCKPGYYLTYRTKTCTICGQGWGNYDTYSSEIYGYDMACMIKCPTGCSNCQYSYECLSCNAGFKFNFSSKNCYPCDVGKGRALDTSVQAASTTCDIVCSEECKWCGATPEECLGCHAGYSYSLDAKTCTPCASGTTNLSPASISLASTTCNIICDSKCAACEGTSTKCTRCAAGYFFTAATNTCTECPAGKGRAEDLIAPTADTVCDVTCQSPCTKCGESETSCLGCEAHFKYNFATKSCTTCPAGTTKAADSTALLADSKCDILCAPGCSLCSGTAIHCLGCQAGYKYNQGSNSCSTCELNKGRAEDTTTQLADTTCGVSCDPGCLFCGDQPAVCLGCAVNYRLDWSTKTCIACTQGVTRPADTVAQTAGTTCNIKCASECTFCSGTATKCYGCQAGFKYTATGFSCTSCPINQGRAANLAPISSDTTCEQTCSGDCLFCGATPT